MTTHRKRVIGHLQRAAGALVFLTCATGLVASNAQPIDEDQAPAAAAPATDPLDTLQSEYATDEQRRESARDLVAQKRFEDLAAAINSGASGPIIQAITESLEVVRPDDIPEALIRALGLPLLRPDLPREARLASLRVLQRFRTRAAVRPLIESLAVGLDREGLVATCDALARQSGRLDLADDPDAWRTWWTSVEWLTEAEWRTRLADAHARRADTLVTQRDDLERRWLEAMRRLHGLTSSQDRSVLIRDLLTDASPAARRLGLEFVEQALLNARSLDPSVMQMAVERIGDPDADVRTYAATVAARTNPEAASRVAAAALATERNPQTAAALLGLLARRPISGASSHALTWLKTGGQASDAAAEALISLASEGRVQDPSTRLQVRELARTRLARADQSATSQAIWARLLLVVGTWEDAALAVTFLPLTDPTQSPSTGWRIDEQPSGLRSGEGVSGVREGPPE